MAKVDLKKENAKLQKQITKLQTESSNQKNRIQQLEADVDTHKTRADELESQLGDVTHPQIERWEVDLKKLVNRNPEAAKQAMLESNGLPNNYDEENLYQHVHDRAVAFGPAQFIERIQNIIERG